MNIHPQLIVKNSVPEFVVLPFNEYKNMLDAIEENEDIKAVKDFHDSDQETIPFNALQKIAKGEHPIKIFRELQDISQAKLAKNVGITRQYLHQIENKQRKGNAKILKKIANILKVDLDLLII